jgi:hypothetical protein
MDEGRGLAVIALTPEPGAETVCRPAGHGVPTPSSPEGPGRVSARVELANGDPHTWREVEIASDAYLHDVLGALQIVLGWTDSPRHRFCFEGDDWNAPDRERFITDLEYAEGEGGAVESGVRVDELVHEAGDQVLYLYGHRLRWRHTVTLHGECPLPAGAGQRARCLDGAGAVPNARAGCESFDVIERIAADPPAHAEVDVDLAREMTEPFAWMIRWIGDGLLLSTSGFRLDDLKSVVDKLGTPHDWVGRLAREDQVPEVTRFRTVMRQLGLVRLARSRLWPTKIGGALVDDPVGLWWHIADRLPLDDRARDIALFELVTMAAGLDPHDPSDGRVYESLRAGLGGQYPELVRCGRRTGGRHRTRTRCSTSPAAKNSRTTALPPSPLRAASCSPRQH